MDERVITYIAGAAAAVLCFAALTGAADKPPLTDIAISDAVEDELDKDAAVPFPLIDVAVTDGIVTLSGRVDNLLSKERAARIAKIVKGVQAVINTIEVDPPVLRTDRRIREDVEDALLTDPATDLFDVRVSVENNRVTLFGGVDSHQEKVLCEKTAKGVKGVAAVDNKIDVSWPEERADYQIKAEIERALAWDVFVDHALIEVDVEDGNVSLTGVVGSAAEKSEAAFDAQVHGVSSVNDEGLEVKRWARDPELKGKKYMKKSDEAIRTAVEDALLYDPRISPVDIRLDVSDGTVTLRGTVDHLEAKRAAARDARNTVGVKQVDNRIKVRPETPPSDLKTERRARAALVRDPFLAEEKITVNVVNGVAELHGTVDTRFQKTQADDIAAKVEGVIMVDNNLIVQDQDRPFLYDDDPRVDDRSYGYERFKKDRPRFPAKTDPEIRQDIADEFFWSPFVDGDDIIVTVDDGVATLTGTVGSRSEYNAAANNAYEGGAVYVKNELEIARASDQ